MPQDVSAQHDDNQAKSLWARFKSPSKKVFWVWVGYQAVKGTLTTSLIWIPLIWAWIHHNS